MSGDIIERLTRTPEDVFLLYKDTSSVAELNQLAKKFVDPIAKDNSVLDEVFVDGLDSTQVYGQIKMVLEGLGETMLYEKIPELKQSNVDNLDDENDVEDEEGHLQEQKIEVESDDQFQDAMDENIQGENDSQVSESGNEDDEEPEVEETASELAENDSTDVIKKDAFGLNDTFFDIDEFNKQSLAMEENDFDNNDSEEIDYFAELSDEEEDDDEEQMSYFNDFFDKPKRQEAVKEPENKKTDAENEAENEDDFEFDDLLDESDYEDAVETARTDLFDDEDYPVRQTQEGMSSFEKQQQQLQEEIKKLEAELVGEKKWGMKGEVSAKDRPEDSLLDDPTTLDLDFERTAKPVPVITQEVSESIEEMIKRRIKEEKFDDLPRRLVTDAPNFRERLKFDLSEEKSSKSLAELYEDEFQGTETNDKEISEELQKKHDEISELFNSITYKLDALTSAHFTPKPHHIKEVEIKVTDGAPASISMEDAQPLSVSSETALAPQEVFKIQQSVANGKEGRKELSLKSGLSYSKDELSRNDKQRLRRAAKRKRSKDFKERKELQSQKAKQNSAESTSTSSNKKARKGEVMDTLSKAKNISIIGQKGELRDIKGKVKTNNLPKGSSGFKL